MLNASTISTLVSLLLAAIMTLTSGTGAIYQPVASEDCPNYYGDVSTAGSLPVQTIDENPNLVARGWNGMHGNGYNTGTYNSTGPKGINPLVTSQSLNTFGGLSAIQMFDSKGRLITVSGGIAGFKLLLLDPVTLDVLAETDMPARASTKDAILSLDFDKISSDTSGGAYCHLLEGDRPLICNANKQLNIYSIDESSGSPEWQIDATYDMTQFLGDDDLVSDVVPDYDGNYWFVCRDGVLGYIEKGTDGNEFGDYHMLKLDGEEIQNSLAVAEDGVYIVSDYAQYKFTIDENGDIKQNWRTEYDRGTTVKGGSINQGSGTTPTLLDIEKNDGTTLRTVAITDNADGQVNLLVYNRDTGKLVADPYPLFEEGKSTSENSLIAYDHSFIIENNYTETDAAFLAADPQSEPGVWRVDLNEDCNELELAWASDEASSTVVPKLSTGSGLVYLYTRVQNEDIDEDTVAWYFTAVDFRTGETVYKVFTGTGANWNNSYAPITIGPDGTAYVGVFNGIISVRDDPTGQLHTQAAKEEAAASKTIRGRLTSTMKDMLLSIYTVYGKILALVD